MSRRFWSMLWQTARWTRVDGVTTQAAGGQVQGGGKITEPTVVGTFLSFVRGQGWGWGSLA